MVKDLHILKLDIENHNLNWWGYEYSDDYSAVIEKYWELPMGGFILHTGSYRNHMFNYVVVRIGGGGNATWDF